jgi:Domain of unknown function (DUF4386)
MQERVMLRIGTVSLALGLALAVIFETLHPSRENPNDNPRVFAEYAHSSSWTTIHLGQLAGALLLIVGLAALSSSLALGRPVSAAWARLATGAAVAAAPAYGVLQVVDGVALKRAVDEWAAAPDDQRTAAFAAAQTVRWIEYGLNALTFSLVGLTLILIGVAMLTGDRFPRWAGGWAAAAGLAYLVKGLGVAYQGFAGGVTGLIALVLFGTWVLAAAWLMWRRASAVAKQATVGPTPGGASSRTGTMTVA